MGNEWKPFIKHPWTSLRDLGVNPAVQVGGEAYGHALLATICGEIARSGLEPPPACRPPKPRAKRDTVAETATAPE